MINMIGSKFPAIGLLILLAIVAGVITLFASGRIRLEDYPYEREDTLFSHAERSFPSVLEQSVGEKYRIFGNVRITDGLAKRS